MSVWVPAMRRARLALEARGTACSETFSVEQRAGNWSRWCGASGLSWVYRWPSSPRARLFLFLTGEQILDKYMRIKKSCDLIVGKSCSDLCQVSQCFQISTRIETFDCQRIISLIFTHFTCTYFLRSLIYIFTHAVFCIRRLGLYKTQ